MRAPRFGLALVTLAAASPAAAHITLTSPAPRSSDQKAEPCGLAGGTRGTNVTTFAPGETITVTWDEPVDHPGHYRISFDDDGDDDFVNPSMPDDDFATTLVDQIVDRVGGGAYSQQVTLPDVECEACTLQLVQIMTTSVPYDSFYWQCADLRLARAGDPDPEPDPEDKMIVGGCQAGGGGAGALTALALVAGLWARRRRW
ncbi:MAG: SCE4755 family polysaccharide monooxygenase-like protein [Kofleriaceae bacterium]